MTDRVRLRDAARQAIALDVMIVKSRLNRVCGALKCAYCDSELNDGWHLDHFPTEFHTLLKAWIAGRKNLGITDPATIATPREPYAYHFASAFDYEDFRVFHNARVSYVPACRACNQTMRGRNLDTAHARALSETWEIDGSAQSTLKQNAQNSKIEEARIEGAAAFAAIKDRFTMKFSLSIPVMRRFAISDENGWFIQAGVGDELFRLAGLPDSRAFASSIADNEAYITMSNSPCPFYGCTNGGLCDTSGGNRAHSSVYVINPNKYGTVMLTYFKKGMHDIGSQIVELDESVTRKLQTAWWRENESATNYVIGDGCFYKTIDGVTFRVFMPWGKSIQRDNDAGESGGRCLNSIPAELWNRPFGGDKTSDHLNVAKVLTDVEKAEHIKMRPKSVMREFGPSATGDTLCGVEFTSDDPCTEPGCGAVHESCYRVAIVRYKIHHGTETKTLLYSPCSTKGRAVYKQLPSSRRKVTDTDLDSLWHEEPAAKKPLGANVTTRSSFAESLARIVSAATWEEKLAAATDSIDVGTGKNLGTSAHYRGNVTPPARDGSVQPRVVTRISYTVEDGLRIFYFYERTNKTLSTGPTGVAGKERPSGMDAFAFERPC
jgi:hypothetical protein